MSGDSGETSIHLKVVNYTSIYFFDHHISILIQYFSDPNCHSYRNFKMVKGIFFPLFNASHTAPLFKLQSLILFNSISEEFHGW